MEWSIWIKKHKENKDNDTLVIARGIGMALIPVVQRLVQNGNKVTVILENHLFKDILYNGMVK